MTKAIDMFFATRPMLHLPVWTVYLVTLRLGTAAGTSFSGRHLLVMAGLSLIVAGAYYLNQIYDYESDRINDKLGFLQRGLAGKRLFAFLFVLTSVAGLVVMAVVSVKLLIPVGLQFLLGVAYSAPPLRLKDRPWLGLLTNSVCFGALIPVVAAIAGGAAIDHLTPGTLVLAGYFFCAVAATHIMTTLPDREGDATIGKRTVAVVLPQWAVRLLAVLFLVTASAVAFRMEVASLLLLAMVSLWIVLAGYIVRSPKIDLFAAKFPLLVLTLLAGYYYPGYLLFVVALVIATRIYYRRRFGIVYPRLA